MSISIGKSVTAISVIGVGYRVGIESDLCTINGRMRKGSIAVIHKNITVRIQHIDDLIIDITLILNIRHHIANNIDR